MYNQKRMYKKNQWAAVISSITGCAIGLYPLWNYKFLMVIILGVLSALFIKILKVKYDYIVILNIILLPIALFEPSPADISFILLLLFGLVNGELKLEKLREQFYSIILIAGFLIINLLGMYNMQDHYQGIKYFTITLYLLVFAFFFYIYLKEERWINIFRAYIVSTVFSALLGLIGYMGYFSHILMYDKYRMQGLFKDPNVFGPFLVPSVIILLWDGKARKIFGDHIILYILSLGLVIMGIAFSFSRGAWANLLVSILTYYILNLKKYPIKKIIIIFLIIILCSYFIWQYAFNEELREFFISRSTLQGYDGDRFTSQKVGLSLATKKMFGYGPGQYELLVLKKMGMKLSAHNLYIRLMLENGILAFVFLLFFFLYILQKLFQLHLIDDSRGSLFISILIGILVNSLVIDTLHWRHFWLFVGLNLSIINEKKDYLI